MKIQPIRGTHDLFGDEISKYRKLEKEVNNLATINDFNEIITPIFESTYLFSKPLGEQSDVVLKEMYTFEDKNGDSLTLRPEHTTPMLRAAISNNFLEKIPSKLFGVGPVFRRERPQKGRYRQFNQINFEILGTNDILADVELIILANSLIKNLMPNKKIILEINSLGDKNALNKFKSDLSIYFDKFKNTFSKDIQDKINSNPIRILDSKELYKNEIIYNSPKISDYYSKEANIIFENIKKLLSDLNIDFLVNQNLVRGLDYYCHTVFEFKSNDLGAQDTLIGGGRYDGLIKLLGGPDLPGVGWAGGVERILMLMDNANKYTKSSYLIIMDEEFKNYGLRIASELRKNSIKVHFDYKYNLKKSLSNASQIKSEYALIIGENEVNNNVCTIKNLKKNTQETTTIDKIISELIK